MIKKIKEVILDNLPLLTVMTYIVVMFTMSIICEPVACVMAMVGLVVFLIIMAWGFLLA